MKAETRRKEIIASLTGLDSPMSASKLAESLNVSRQIIVQDIAILRASGYKIQSLARGYLLENEKAFARVLKTIHSDDEVEDELNTIIDFGGIVKEVFIYHKAYGRVSAPMNIKTRNDIKSFIKDIQTGKSTPLKNVTAGFHYHTVIADSEEILKDIENALWEKGYLATLKEYEPEEIQILVKNKP